MLTDAIKQILSFMDMYPQIYKFEIVEEDNITIHMTDCEAEDMTGTIIEVMEWCEENLRQAN